jgi:hypothetical protein
MASRSQLLRQELVLIQAFLDEFEPPENDVLRRVTLEGGETGVVVRNYPLPDGYAPDQVDLLIDVSNYPSKPPIGLYILINNNEKIIQRIKRIFGDHVFGNHAYYGARDIEGFAWICLHYKDHKWSFNARQVNRGDNLQKFLEMFQAGL